MAELILDPAIRFWVFIPIVLITFLVGIIRHYVSLILTSEKPLELQQLSDSQVLMRCKLLKENGKYIPAEAYLMRKQYFCNKDTGFLVTQQRPSAVKNPVTDPTMMTEMIKGNVINMVPMVIIGGWINWAFSGFLCTKVPFSLTYRFKPMLQRGVELLSLDPSWVSSISWYALNIFGLRSMYTLLLGENNAADQTKLMHEQFSGTTAMYAIQDTARAFKVENDTLMVTPYEWILKNIEQDMIR